MLRHSAPSASSRIRPDPIHRDIGRLEQHRKRASGVGLAVGRTRGRGEAAEGRVFGLQVVVYVAEGSRLRGREVPLWLFAICFVFYGSSKSAAASFLRTHGWK